MSRNPGRRPEPDKQSCHNHCHDRQLYRKREQAEGSSIAGLSAILAILSPELEQSEEGSHGHVCHRDEGRWYTRFP